MLCFFGITLSEKDLNALPDRVREGSAEALGEYLNAIKPRLLGLLHHLTGEHLQRVVETADLFQEVAARQSPRSPKSLARFSMWMLGSIDLPDGDDR